MMSHLWTPWRMSYLRGEASMPAGCLFCIAHQAGESAEIHIPYRGNLCYVILNRFPYNNGHLMVVPYVHEPMLENLDAATAGELIALTQLSLRVLRTAYNPQGFNIGLNIGEAAGAGVVGHLHMHVVPRWGGDTNYMTTVGDTRVIPERLEDTCALLRPLFQELSRNHP